MRELIIFGVGEIACQVFQHIILEKKYRVVAFTINKQYCSISSLFGLPVVPFEELDILFPNKNYCILVCIGFNQMNKTRKNIFDMILEKGYEIIGYKHDTATVLTKEVGLGNIILENVNISIGCKIGNGNIFVNNSVVCHDVKMKDFNYVSPGSVVLGHAKIGSFCFLGANSTIKDNIIVDDYNLIGANAFVNKNTLKNDVYVPPKSYKLKKYSYEMIEHLY